jgi:tRNA ligase
MVHRLMSDRITQRGTNHQTLHADTSASRAHEDVLWMFLKGTEELAESEVDVVVEMDLAATPEQQLRTAVDALVRELSLKMPTDEQINEALAVAQGYKPKITNVQETRTKAKGKGQGPRYYAILPEINLGTTLESLIPNAENEDAAPKEFWARLKNQDRVIKTPHITLVHQKSLPAEQAAWDACAAVSHAAEPPLFSFRFSTLLWNDRVMALVVDDLALSSDMPENDKDAVGSGWLVTLPEDVRSRLHITVGTWTDSIVPFEARALVDAWRAGKEKGISAMPITDLVVQGRLKGLHG